MNQRLDGPAHLRTPQAPINKMHVNWRLWPQFGNVVLVSAPQSGKRGEMFGLGIWAALVVHPQPALRMRMGYVLQY